MIPYSRQFLDEDDIKAVVEVLRSDFLTQGPKIEEFQTALSHYCGARYAVVFSSGTAALHAAYFSAGISAGDEIITSPLTFAATANACLYLGARPVFADVEMNTGNIDLSKTEERITKKTKLLVPVHYAGHPADLEKMYKTAKKNNLVIVEDACHALGAQYKREKIGNCKYSAMTILSFHPVKHITTGEGGAVLTNNKDYYEKLLMFRTHGITKDKAKFKVRAKSHVKDSLGLNLNLNLNLNLDFDDWYYEMQYLGYNYRMTDIQAALGISQLKKLDSFVERRRNIADLYNKAFHNNPCFDIPFEKNYASTSYHLYPIRIKDAFRDKKREIFSTLRRKGLGVQVHYIPVYLQPYYRNLGYKKGLCPVAEDFYRREISIPLYPGMTHDNIKHVVSTMKALYA